MSPFVSDTSIVSVIPAGSLRAAVINHAAVASAFIYARFWLRAAPALPALLLDFLALPAGVAQRAVRDRHLFVAALAGLFRDLQCPLVLPLAVGVGLAVFIHEPVVMSEPRVSGLTCPGPGVAPPRENLSILLARLLGALVVGAVGFWQGYWRKAKVVAAMIPTNHATIWNASMPLRTPPALTRLVVPGVIKIVVQHAMRHKA